MRVKRGAKPAYNTYWHRIRCQYIHQEGKVHSNNMKIINNKIKKHPNATVNLSKAPPSKRSKPTSKFRIVWEIRHNYPKRATKEARKPIVSEEHQNQNVRTRGDGQSRRELTVRVPGVISERCEARSQEGIKRGQNTKTGITPI